MKRRILGIVLMLCMTVSLVGENVSVVGATENSTVQSETLNTDAAATASTQITQTTESVSTESTESTEAVSTENTKPTEAVSTESTESTEAVSTESTESTEAVSTESTESTESVSTESTESTEAVSTKSTESTETEIATGSALKTIKNVAVEENDALGATQGTIINCNVIAAQNTDITSLLQTELNKARDDKNNTYYITILAGSYKISKTLHIYSNTTLSMQGVTITGDNTSGNMLMVGTTAMNNLEDTSYSTASGYNGYANITLSGGTWIGNNSNESCMVRFLHAKNITMDHVTLQGGGGKHQGEVCAIDGFYVRYCTFKDFTYHDQYNDHKLEALQIDIPCSEEVFKDVYEDGTPMKNMYIEHCTFSNVPRGVGTHTSLLGTYHENVYIRNNVFKNISEEAIVALDYYNCEISGNTITNCGAGILVQHMKKDSGTIYTTTEDGTYTGVSNFKKDANTTIANNTITIKYNANSDEVQAIKLYGRKLTSAEKDAKGKSIAAGDYYITGVAVTNNTIKTAGRGIHLMDAKNCTIASNTVTGASYSSSDAKAVKKQYDGIFLECASTGNSITGNAVTSVLRNGIFVYDGSSATDISSNTVTSCKKYGIAVSSKSKNSGSIHKNKVKSSSASGIFVSDSSSVNSITSNTVSSSGDYGIGVWKKGTVKGAISGNTITSSNSAGISVSTSSTVSDITSNTLSKTKDSAISIYSKCTVKGSIGSNSITDVKDTKSAILISTSSTVNGKIQKNKILKSKNSYSCAQGIVIYKSSTVKGAIDKNTIKNCKDNAIALMTSGKTGSITGNTLKSLAGTGIFVYQSSKISGDISGNVIDKPKASGIYLTDKATVTGSVMSNTITSPKQMGIFLSGSSTVKAIKKNTITGAGGNAIDLASAKNNITISDNVIKSGSDNAILIRTGTTKYKITITGNKLSVKSVRCGVYAMSGKLSISKNTITKNSKRIILESGASGTIGKNTYK